MWNKFKRLFKTKCYHCNSRNTKVIDSQFLEGDTTLSTLNTYKCNDCNKEFKRTRLSPG